METKKNSNEILKTIVATLIGIILIASSWYYVEEFNKEERREEESSAEEKELEEIEKVITEDDLLMTPESKNTENDMATLVSCLKENNVVVYGNRGCGHCVNLVESFGGYDVVDGLYVECPEERERCDEEKKTTYVPEIQIAGDLYEGGRLPSQLAAAVNCVF